MLKKFLPVFLALLLLSACSSQEAPQPSGNEGETLTIAATTRPVYLLVSAVTFGVETVNVTQMIDQEVGCLHDYTLTVNDMKVLESSDVVFLNGAGLEDSMLDALTASGTPLVECAQGDDPHVWLDPSRACQMVEVICESLVALDPAHAAAYQSNASSFLDTIRASYEHWKTALADLPTRELITFHDGFSCFAEAFDLSILRAIEEESGSEASAQEVADISALVTSHHLPAIFTEVNGATASADLISQETGVPVFQLDLMLSRLDPQGPPVDGTTLYTNMMAANVNTILEAYT